MRLYNVRETCRSQTEISHLCWRATQSSQIKAHSVIHRLYTCIERSVQFEKGASNCTGPMQGSISTSRLDSMQKATIGVEACGLNVLETCVRALAIFWTTEVIRFTFAGRTWTLTGFLALKWFAAETNEGRNRSERGIYGKARQRKKLRTCRPCGSHFQHSLSEQCHIQESNKDIAILISLQAEEGMHNAWVSFPVLKCRTRCTLNLPPLIFIEVSLLSILK